MPRPNVDKGTIECLGCGERFSRRARRLRHVVAGLYFHSVECWREWLAASSPGKT